MKNSGLPSLPRQRTNWMGSDDQKWLFPDEFGLQPIRSYKQLAGIVGSFYEAVVGKLFGADVLVTNGHLDVCPDLVNRSSNTLIESKAGKAPNIRIDLDQLKAYQAYLDRGYGVWYAICPYGVIGREGRQSLLKQLPERTLLNALKYFCFNTLGCLTLDMSIIIAWMKTKKVFEYEKENVPYPPVAKLNLGEIRKYIAAPTELLRVLKLKLFDYIIVQSWAKRLVIAGVEMQPFPVSLIIKHQPERREIKPEDLSIIREEIKLKGMGEEIPF